MSAPKLIEPLELPAVFLPLITKAARYKVYYGGRGGAKSWAFAGALIYMAARVKLRVLCAREIQGSIADSVHKLLADTILRLGYSEFFTVTANSIKCNTTGSEFLFKGLRHNVMEIKSMEGIDIVWVEEAQKVSKTSWDILIPTIRKSGSEIWMSFNPDREHDPTYQMFVVNQRPDSIVVKVSWRDNPYFPEELDKERRFLQSVDPDAYDHVWEGGCSNVSAAQILRGKYVVAPFAPEPGWNGPYWGADWGFANDPTTLVKLWIFDGKLYVEAEVTGVGVDIDKTPAMFDKIPGARKYTIRADCARPETISYMQRHGYGSVVGCEKWSGSVEDGIAHLRSYRQIVIHPSCERTIDEAKKYSYKTDRLTDDVLPDVIDANNHCMDAIRYALGPMIRNNKMGALAFIEQQAQGK